jgi:hypothetical protein
MTLLARNYEVSRKTEEKIFFSCTNIMAYLWFSFYFNIVHAKMTFHPKAPDWSSDVITNFLFLSIIPAMTCPFSYIKKQFN